MDLEIQNPQSEFLSAIKYSATFVYLYCMLQLLGYLIFILSVALTSGGIILSSKLRSRYNMDIFSALVYYQVFIYAFGFYGIWGQVIIRVLALSSMSQDTISRISNTAILLGLPFLVFAWLMLIRFSCLLSGRKTGRFFIPAFLVINFAILAALGFITARSKADNPGVFILYYYIGMNIVYSFLSSYLIHLPVRGKSVIHERDGKIIAISIFALMIIQCAVLLFTGYGPVAGLIFILVFFLGNSFLPVYFSYGALPMSFSGPAGESSGFEEFCRRFEVSPRESEVIKEICNGLSNKEISEKLFISLQTVKDHTHRIYIKTNVKSRVQLINFIKESE